MIEFYITRHGETENNKKKISQGQRADSSLTEKGIISAKQKIKKLKNIEFDILISSDLGRAKETAKLINEELNLRLKFSKELREVDFGDFSGIKTDELRNMCPQYKKKVDYIFPNGESYGQVRKRSINYIKNLEGKYNKVLLITHAGVIRGMFAFFKKIDYNNVLDMKISNDVIIRSVIDKGEPVEFEFIQE